MAVKPSGRQPDVPAAFGTERTVPSPWPQKPPAAADDTNKLLTEKDFMNRERLAGNE